mgnify:CR=1 FL=1
MVAHLETLRPLVGTVTLWQVTGVVPSLPIPGFEHLPPPDAPVAGQRYFFFTVMIFVSYHMAASMARRLWERTRDLLRLKERAEDAYARTRTLYDIARAATSTLDLPAVLQVIAESTARAMGARCASPVESHEGRLSRAPASSGARLLLPRSS